MRYPRLNYSELIPDLTEFLQKRESVMYARGAVD